MGRKSVTGGVQAKGSGRIQFDFEYQGVRYRPTLARAPTEGEPAARPQAARGHQARIANDTFSFTEEFPDFRHGKTWARRAGRAPAMSCSTSSSRIASRGSQRTISPSSTVDSYRKLLDSVWRPEIGRVLFENVRYTQLAKIADKHKWSKKTYNNAISALRCAFEYGYRIIPRSTTLRRG